MKPGSEEYLDSEKYQIRVAELRRADSLAELIARVNAIRREHPALQRDWGLRFHRTDNPQLIAYSKRSEDGADLILTIVDSRSGQHAARLRPAAARRLGASRPTARSRSRDLLSGERYFWRGEWNYVRLDPHTPARTHPVGARSPRRSLPSLLNPSCT